MVICCTMQRKRNNRWKGERLTWLLMIENIWVWTFNKWKLVLWWERRHKWYDHHCVDWWGMLCVLVWFIWCPARVVNLKTGDEAGIWSTGTCKYTKVRRRRILDVVATQLGRLILVQIWNWICSSVVKMQLTGWMLSWEQLLRWFTCAGRSRNLPTYRTLMIVPWGTF